MDDNYFLGQCIAIAAGSKDPNTRVGALVTDYRGVILMSGFNGFPQSIEDSPERLADRSVKLALILHAEENVVVLAARKGIALEGGTLYVACTDDSGAIWGGPPCGKHCALQIIQAGIIKVVARPMKAMSKWREDLEFSLSLLQEAGVLYREVPLIKTFGE